MTPKPQVDELTQKAMDRLQANPNMPEAAKRMYRRVIAGGVIQAQLKRAMARSRAAAAANNFESGVD